MRAILNDREIVLGTCYYPEHWDERLWDEDLARMQEAGIRVIRIAEFAWSKVEPREGEYTYEFFDSFLEHVARTDLKVIFCTPTATPPAWLTEHYPEVLNAAKDGTLYRHGARRHYNYNSPVYQRFAANITEKFAGHYAKHPSVIGWQIDNEINCETDEFYSQSDTLAFREFLKKRYGTVEALNEAWTRLEREKRTISAARFLWIRRAPFWKSWARQSLTGRLSTCRKAASLRCEKRAVCGICLC